MVPSQEGFDIFEASPDSTELILNFGDLTKLPAEIQRFTSVERLDLQHNYLTELPPEIGRLGELVDLDASLNRLSSLPKEIGLLKRLERLDLSGNHLTALPPELGQLSRLEFLDLSGNYLTDLPPEIGALPNLKILNLSGNKLSSLPSAVGQLRNLRILDLGSNGLSALPPEFGQLTMLGGLSLRGNNLVNLPPEFGQLSNLEIVFLADNKLAHLPQEFGDLLNLERLDLAGNELTTLPASIGQLTSLIQLDLEENRLTILPPEIGLLSNLRGLDLTRNLLSTLPTSMSNFAETIDLRLSGNPLTGQMVEAVELGVPGLINYLRALSRDGVVQYEAKLLLVGEGEVGKSSLLAALQGRQFQENRETTHGIEKEPLKLNHPHFDALMTLNVWDFGGQEIYRITHQFFFSPNALYLLVWKPRQGQEQNDVEGWLRRIRLRVGGDARVIVVATHGDERHPELNYPGLKREFGDLLAGHFKVDNKSGLGIEELRIAIADQAALLDQMGSEVSQRWIDARNALLALPEPQVSFSTFQEECLRHELDSDEVATLARFLHVLGHIVYYGDDDGLRDIVVLKPDWLTKAIGYVLEDGPTRQASGVLDHRRLKDIWESRPDGYPRENHPYFLRLMEKFDISYRREGGQESLVAQLVPYERPVLPWETTDPPAQRSLRLFCETSEVAPGLIAWLTVRHNEFTMGKHWRSGVFLRYPDYESDGLIELVDDKRLTLEVRAPSPDYFFSILRHGIEFLIKARWPGLDYELSIPCPTKYGEGLGCAGSFALLDLNGCRQDGMLQVPCLKCRKSHDVSSLLTGFSATPEPPGSALTERKLDQSLANVIQQHAVLVDKQFSSIENAMRNLLEGQRDLSRRQEVLAERTADMALGLRIVLRIINKEVTDCPGLFTLTPEVGAKSKIRFWEQRSRLTLWCEHPDHEHPWEAATYPLPESKEWFAKIAPYAQFVINTLKLIVPLAGAAAGAAMDESSFKAVSGEVKLAEVASTKLPSQPLADNAAFRSEGLTAAEGEGLRVLRSFLFETDPQRFFGGLRRYLNPSGDFLWICPTHRVHYDPGLPTLPQ